MLTLVTILHVCVALILIFLVLVQDSKGGAGGAFGGGTSNSLLGPTGATSLAAKATRIVAIVFAGTCLTLTLMTARNTSSVVDSLPAGATSAPPAPGTAPVQEAAPAATSEKAPTTAPAPAEQAPATNK